MGRNHGIRLIDADELKNNIKKWLTVDPSESRLVDIDDIAVSVLMEIDEAHTVDVQPVIHARWVDEGDCHRCSKCRAVLEEDFKLHYHQYCYHCGARMEGVDK